MLGTKQAARHKDRPMQQTKATRERLTRTVQYVNNIIAKLVPSRAYYCCINCKRASYGLRTYKTVVFVACDGVRAKVFLHA